MQVVAVRVEDGWEHALAAVLVRLAGAGDMVIVQSVPAAAGRRQPYALIMAIQAELPSDGANLVVLRAAAVAESAAVRLRGGTAIALVPVEAVDPVPTAMFLGGVLDADEVLLAEQFRTGLVLRRIGPPRDRGQPWEELPA